MVGGGGKGWRDGGRGRRERVERVFFKNTFPC